MLVTHERDLAGALRSHASSIEGGKVVPHDGPRMKVLGFALRAFRRDLRAGELSILLMAIVVAVTAMTAVGFFTDRVGGAMKDQASQVLAADLVLRSAGPINPDYLRDAQELGLETAETLAFPTVVLSGEQTTLAAIDAVSGTYPLRGQLTVADTLFGNGRPATDVPGPGRGLGRARPARAARASRWAPASAWASARCASPGSCSTSPTRTSASSTWRPA